MGFAKQTTHGNQDTRIRAVRNQKQILPDYLRASSEAPQGSNNHSTLLYSATVLFPCCSGLLLSKVSQLNRVAGSRNSARPKAPETLLRLRARPQLWWCVPVLGARTAAAGDGNYSGPECLAELSLKI